MEPDDLVVGAFATAMACADTSLSEDAGASVLMVERHHRPDGHRNDADALVRLHQPSPWYGLASGRENFERSMGSQLAQLKAIAEATSAAASTRG